jgi:hypothetical protein
MIQIAMVVVSVCLIVLGIKGFTRSGLALSKTTTLTGTSAKVVGVLCILGGIAVIPMFLLLIALMSARP